MTDWWRTELTITDTGVVVVDVKGEIHSPAKLETLLRCLEQLAEFMPDSTEGESPAAEIGDAQ